MPITKKILIIALCLLTSGCVVKHLEEHFRGQGPLIQGLDHVIVEENPDWLVVAYHVIVRQDVVEGYAKLYVIDVESREPIYSGITQPFDINRAFEGPITLRGLFEIDKRGEILIEVVAKNRKGKEKTRRYQFYVENTL